MIGLNFNHDENDELFQEGPKFDKIKGFGSTIRSGVKSGINRGEKFNTTLGNTSDTMSVIDREVGKHRVDNRSLIARARNSTLHFPVYVSQSCPVNAANTIANAWERLYATLVQSVFSQNPFIDEDEANDMAFLRKFHSNIHESAEEVFAKYQNLINEYYQPIDEFDQLMQESIFHRVRLTDNCYVEFRVVPTDDVYLIAESARLANDPLAGLLYLQEKEDDEEPKRYNTKSTENTNQRKYLTDDDFRDMAMDQVNLSKEEMEVLQTSFKDYAGDPADRINYDERSGKYHRYRQNAIDKINDKIRSIKKDIKDGNIKGYKCDSAGRYYYSASSSTKYISTIKGDAVDAPKLLRDADIKKINNALPLSMEVTFRVRTSNGQDVDRKYVVLVKTIMHLIRAQDLAEDLQDLIMGSQKNLRKVQYKTGEIGWMDYIFNTSALKANAAERVNSNKRWLSTLKTLGDYQKFNGAVIKEPTQLLNNGAVPIPNGTLLLTQPDISMLTSETGIDLSSVANAAKLMKRLFLFTMIIVDASDGTLRVLKDGDEDWDIQSLASIDAETSKTDNSQLARELNRMINR